jgi:mono/diheme cytochrome c family protein
MKKTNRKIRRSEGLFVGSTTKPSDLLIFLFFTILWLSACRTRDTLVNPDPHLERMLYQAKVVPYGQPMLQPPDGTLPTTASLDDPAVRTGVANGAWVDRIPVTVDRAMIEHGQRDFDHYCAACHGMLGDGQSVVADKMTLRRPKDLTDADARDYPPGRIFQTVRQGYGLMPSYSVQLTEKDTWGVVAYVRALQIARGARVAELPPEVRAELQEKAP